MNSYWIYHIKSDKEYTEIIEIFIYRFNKYT